MLVIPEKYYIIDFISYWGGKKFTGKGRNFMNYDYIEYMIKRKTTVASVIARVASILFVVVCVMLYPILNFVAFGISIIAAYLVRYTFQTTNVEYEYTYIAGECRIDKVMSKRKRKKCTQFELDKVEVIAPEGHESLKGYENKECSLKKYVSGEQDAKRYIVYERKDADLVEIIFEPNEKLLKAMQNYAPRKIII